MIQHAKIGKNAASAVVKMRKKVVKINKFAGIGCKENSQHNYQFVQMLDSQRGKIIVKKKRCFSGREVPLFDARSGAFLPEKHRFAETESPFVNKFPNFQHYSLPMAEKVTDPTPNPSP